MSKLGSFALVLAVICLQVVFALGEHATKNESSVCSSISPVEVARLVDIIAANNEENANKIKEVKELLASPSTRREDVPNNRSHPARERQRDQRPERTDCGKAVQLRGKFFST